MRLLGFAAAIPALATTTTIIIGTSMTAAFQTPQTPRRSRRLLACSDGEKVDSEDGAPAPPPKRRPAKKRSSSSSSRNKKATEAPVVPRRRNSPASKTTLPRTMEFAVRKRPAIRRVLGIDEAGRGPLAGPVVVAAVCVCDHDDGSPFPVEGVNDSKRIAVEANREVLYEKLVESPAIEWAVAVLDAAKVDEINVLQATLLGMRLVAEALVTGGNRRHYSTTEEKSSGGGEESYPIRSRACISHSGCYVVCGIQQRGETTEDRNFHNEEEASDTTNESSSSSPLPPPSQFYALVDGDRIPDNMPCTAEAVVRGDAREYCIAAASIVAKVTRDRLMHQYDELYPAYGLGRHKGYPTAAHRAAVQEHGGSPIHRRTFAPLRHMDLS